MSVSVSGWFLKIKTFFKFIFIYFCVSVHTQVCVEVIEQLVEVSSFLPPCGFGESNSVRKAWQQAPLPTEPLTDPESTCQFTFLHPCETASVTLSLC